MISRTTPLIVLAALAIGACSSTHYVSIRHPLHVGQVDPNTVPFEARREESTRGLPAGTLTDTASLTEVTPERICVRVNLWSLDEVDSGRGVYQNYRIAMLNDQDGVENDGAQIQLEQPQVQAFQGHVTQRVPAGWRRVCNARRNGRCVSYRRVRIYRTIYVPHIWQVSQSGANICFPNGGFVTPATTRVALEVDGHGPGRMIFEWQFESAVAGAQQQSN